MTTQLLPVNGNMRWCLISNGEIVSHSKTFQGIQRAKVEIPRKKSAAEIERAPEPPPKGSIRRVYWGARQAYLNKTK